jgi:transcriptional regulator
MTAETVPLLKGTLDLLVLKTLSWGPQHGFGIAQWLEARARGEVVIEDGALYHALHRLEERRLLQSTWGVTGNGRKARYYRLTEAGRRHLSTEADTWQRYARVVGRILAVAPTAR